VEERRPLGRKARRWEDNIKLDFKYDCVDWMHVVQNKVQWPLFVSQEKLCCMESVNTRQFSNTYLLIIANWQITVPRQPKAEISLPTQTLGL
jgi:hypothetical protein